MTTPVARRAIRLVNPEVKLKYDLDPLKLIGKTFKDMGITCMNQANIPVGAL